MRRKDREVTDRDAIVDIMENCDVCRLAFIDGDCPYVVPLNFGLDASGEKIELYFHSAKQGHKVDLMEKADMVAFEMDCRHALIYSEEKLECSYAYASVMGKGRITNLEEEEKLAALKLLMSHYYPDREMPFSHKAIPRTLVYKLTVEEYTGKAKVE